MHTTRPHILCLHILLLLTGVGCGTTVMQNPKPMEQGELHLMAGWTPLYEVDAQVGVGVLPGLDLHASGSISPVKRRLDTSLDQGEFDTQYLEGWAVGGGLGYGGTSKLGGEPLSWKVIADAQHDVSLQGTLYGSLNKTRVTGQRLSLNLLISDPKSKGVSPYLGAQMNLLNVRHEGVYSPSDCLTPLENGDMTGRCEFTRGSKRWEAKSMEVAPGAILGVNIWLVDAIAAIQVEAIGRIPIPLRDQYDAPADSTNKEAPLQLSAGFVFYPSF